MLHHVSFSVRQPALAASIAGELLGATPIEAPSPPFPNGSWFVVLGDNAGSMIELTPWQAVHDPNARGMGSDPQMRPCSASHLLASTPHCASEIMALAQRMQLRAAEVDAGLFRFVKVWIEDSFLLELLPPEHAPSYVDCFGGKGLSNLDTRLRDLEGSFKSGY
jgi:hypothetical protein